MSVILVTHDLGVVAETCDRVAVLYAGRIMEAARTRRRFSARQRASLHARPDRLDARCRACRASSSLASPGTPPDPRDPPPGCRFAPRCRHVASACNAGPPEMIALSAEHRAACLRTHDLRIVRAVPV